jgi:DNA-binding response OmpR family regulator
MNKKKIFVLDDDPDFVNMLKVGLELNNYEVITATDGKEALEKIKNDKPDAILLDIVMPDINGYEVCESLKKGNKTANIPIILLTGKDLVPRGIEERCLNLGIDAFLNKPVTLKEVLAKIKEVLQG